MMAHLRLSLNVKRIKANFSTLVIVLFSTDFKKSLVLVQWLISKSNGFMGFGDC